MTKLWPERIDDAEARGYFTDEDKRRIQSWTTCFVPELYPDYNNAQFLRSVRRSIWGPVFRAADAVAENRFAKARRIYYQMAELVKALDNLQDTE